MSCRGFHPNFGWIYYPTIQAGSYCKNHRSLEKFMELKKDGDSPAFFIIRIILHFSQIRTGSDYCCAAADSAAGCCAGSADYCAAAGFAGCCCAGSGCSDDWIRCCSWQVSSFPRIVVLLSAGTKDLCNPHTRRTGTAHTIRRKCAWKKGFICYW